MGHKSGAVPAKKFQRLPVGKMALITADALLQMRWVTPVFQHVFIIIGFKESAMALGKMPHHFFTGISDVCKNTYGNPVMTDNKTMRINGIMGFGEWGYC